MKTSVAILLSGLVAQQASATWDRNAGYFTSPEYNNNECDDKQKGGFDWGDIPTGPMDGYGGFNFPGGWSCANSFGKRDSLTKRNFNSKCIKNKVQKTKPASFDCKSKKEGFSVTEIQVSVEFDCDLEFHYKMPDNSVCKHTAPCKKEGSIVKNTQCGGAQSVEVYLGNHNEEGREDCEIGFHHVGFDCNPGKKPPSYSPPGYGSPPGETPPAESKPPTPPGESKPPSPPGYTPPAESKPPTPPGESKPPSPPGYTPPAESKPPSPPGYTPPAESKPPTPPSSESKPPTPPVYGGNSSIPTPPGQTPPSSPPNESKPPGQTPPATPATSTPVSPKSSSPPEHPGYTPPSCLPKCMNTWLEINTKCKDNTDANCYCSNPDFTKSVIECVAAWSSDEETKQALQYLIGICASYVPQNPGIITNCPPNIPLNPTPPASVPSSPQSSGPAPPAGPGPAPPAVTPAPPAAPPAGPVTTITYQTTLTVPCGCNVPGSSSLSTVSTAVTVPQVVFSTQTPAQPPAPGVTLPAQPVQLVPGTAPPPVPAQTTGAPYPMPNGGTPPSGFGTVTRASGSPTGNPVQFTGAASPVRANFAPAVLGAALAFFAL